MVLAQTPPKFYVYTHVRGDTGAIFYVGKGRGRRHLSRCGRNQLWARIANKHGFSARIVADHLPEDQAFALERDLIAQHRAAGAFLANLTDGGEGPAGREFSDETKAKMRAAKLGRKLSPEHAANIGAAHRGRAWSEDQKNSLRGRAFSPEHRERLRCAATGRKMSREAVEKIAASKRGVRPSEETRAKLSLARLGSKNHNYSPVEYAFSHPDHGIRYCTQNALRREFGMPQGNLSKLLSAARNAVHGWSIIRRGGQ